jgi:hypothetical protein
MRGSNCNLTIKQGAEQGYKSTLYVEALAGTDIAAFETNLTKAINEDLQKNYPGITMTQISDEAWIIDIPDKYKVGHEAHFSQVTEKYLRFLIDGKLPEWEVPNMLVKYYTSTQGLKTSKQSNN